MADKSCNIKLFVFNKQLGQPKYIFLQTVPINT